MVAVMLDDLQVIFWAITYILVLIAAYCSRDIKRMSIPCIAVILNFAWEASALQQSGGMWGHILWFALDCGIVYIVFLCLDNFWKKVLYGAAIYVSVLVCAYGFARPNGMLFLVFLIDLILAVSFLVSRKRLSPKLKIWIAVTKLLGDTFAGLHYMEDMVAVAVMAGIVFVCNVLYLYLVCQELRPREK